MKCPDCNSKLIITEDIEYLADIFDNTLLDVSVAGACPLCGRKFLWTQHYTLTDEDELEDDEQSSFFILDV